MAQDSVNGEWRSLWGDYAPKLILYARQQTPDSTEAEDIVQEAFVRFWKALQRNPALAPALMFTFVKRIAIDHARKRSLRAVGTMEAQVETEPSMTLFENPVEEQERKDILEASLKALPEAQREVLVLKIWGDLTFEEIGKTLEISPFTAASRYRYGLSRLKELLTPSLL